jgi:hypothetical protein
VGVRASRFIGFVPKFRGSVFVYCSANDNDSYYRFELEFGGDAAAVVAR